MPSAERSSHADSPQGLFLALLGGALMLVLSMAFGIPAFQAHNGLANAADRYDRAPGCGASGATDLSIPACQTLAVRVAGRTKHTQSGFSTYYLDLSRSDGSEWQVTMANTDHFWLGNDLWGAAKVGDAASARLWQGRAVLVQIGARTGMTTDSPHSVLWDNVRTMILCVLGAPFGVLVLFATVPRALAPIVGWVRRA